MRIFHRFPSHFALGVVTVAVTLGGLLRSQASACSCVAGITWASPADGEEGVPTNTLIKVQANTFADLHLLDEGGEEVPLITDYTSGGSAVCLWNRDFKPTTELLPDHTYTLIDRNAEGQESTSTSSVQVTFTTGTARYDEELQAPPAFEVIAFEAPVLASGPSGAPGNCAPIAEVQPASTTRTMCVLMSHESPSLEVIASDDESMMRVITSVAGPFPLHLNALDGHVCVTARERDKGGNLSLPTEVCFDAGQIPSTSGAVPLSGNVDCSDPEFVAWYGRALAALAEPSVAAPSEAPVPSPGPDGSTPSRDTGDTRDATQCSMSAPQGRPPLFGIGAFGLISAALLSRQRARSRSKTGPSARAAVR